MKDMKEDFRNLVIEKTPTGFWRALYNYENYLLKPPTGRAKRYITETEAMRGLEIINKGDPWEIGEFCYRIS